MKKKMTCKQHPGLKRNGVLKKGYRYAKGGRLVKTTKNK